MVTNKGAQGTGLGLYLSQALTRGNFGGSLWVEDNPEGGSIFGGSFPLTQRDQAEQGEGSAEPFASLT